MPCSLPLPNGLFEDLYQDLFSYLFVILHAMRNLIFLLDSLFTFSCLLFFRPHSEFIFLSTNFFQNCFSSPSESICNNMIAILLKWRICFQITKYLFGATQSSPVLGNIMVNRREVEGCLPDSLLRKQTVHLGNRLISANAMRIRQGIFPISAIKRALFPVTHYENPKVMFGYFFYSLLLIRS